jgi:hypothetical protein
LQWALAKVMSSMSGLEFADALGYPVLIAVAPWVGAGRLGPLPDYFDGD